MAPGARSLEVLDVAAPCPMNWDAMPGGARSRFCPRCALDVHNLSAMSRAEVARLLQGHEGRLCVRFSRAADGRVKTLDYSSERPPDLRRRRLMIAAASLVGLAAAAVNLLIAGRRAVPTPTVMGDIGPWNSATTAPTPPPANATTLPSAPRWHGSPPPPAT